MPKTEMPLIGILTIPDDDASGCNSSTIDASYVKYLEGGGALTTPILFNATEEEVKEQFLYLNGVFFTGGEKAGVPLPCAAALHVWSLTTRTTRARPQSPHRYGPLL